MTQPRPVLVSDANFPSAVNFPDISYTLKLIAKHESSIEPGKMKSIETQVSLAYCEGLSLCIVPLSSTMASVQNVGPLRPPVCGWPGGEGVPVTICYVNKHTSVEVIAAGEHIANLVLAPYNTL